MLQKSEALHAGDERKPCVLASSGNVGRCAQKAWADPSLRAWADRLPGPPTFHLVAGTIAGAMSPEGTSKRRWCSSESRTLIWYRLTRIPAEYIPRRVKQQPASTATASHLHKPKLSRRSRECVHEVDNVSEDKSSVRQRIRMKT